MSTKKRESANQALIKARKMAAEEYTTNADAKRHYRDGFTEGWHMRSVWERNERDLDEAERTEAARSES